MFINISSDYVQIRDTHGQKNIHRNDVDTQFWPILIQKYRQDSFDKIIMINWPGGFTNLRVWTLCLNILRSLEPQKITISECSKIDIFTYAYQQWFLPRRGIIYIWQKHNVWYYDLKQGTYQTIRKSDIIKFDQDNLFFDFVFDKEYYTEEQQQKIITFQWNEDIALVFHGNILNITSQEICKTVIGIIEPKYMVEPIISNLKSK